MKTTGNPTRQARLVRGGVIQQNAPKHSKRALERQAQAEAEMNKALELARALVPAAIYITAFLFAAFVVVLFVIVATL